MANQVFKVESFVLQDEEGNPGREVRITPLPIKPLRDFMAEFGKLSEAKNDEDATNIIYNCAVIAINARNKEIPEGELENTLDLPTAIKISEIAGGVQLDPNQTAAPATTGAAD